MSKQNDKDQDTEAQSQIKDKLKDMGVIRDADAAADTAAEADHVEKGIPFWRSKLSLVILLALGLWALAWWTPKLGHEQQTSQHAAPANVAGNWSSPYGYPPPAMMGQQMPRRMQDQQVTRERADNSEGISRETWIANQRGRYMTPDRGPYGPPPGWGQSAPYEDYHYYYPPRPPIYYGYAPYYGRPTGYGYPYGWYPSSPPTPPTRTQAGNW